MNRRTFLGLLGFASSGLFTAQKKPIPGKGKHTPTPTPLTMVATAKMFPANLWINVGQVKTVTAAGYDDAVPNRNATFTSYASANPAIAAIANARVMDGSGEIDTLGTPPPNLKEVRGITVGNTTIGATYSGAAATPINVHVNDPAATPVANIAGSSSYTKKLGQVLELDFEASTGVGWKEGQQLIEVNWGDGDTTKGMLSACHAYQLEGLYQVTLTVTNNSGSTSQAMVSVTVEDFVAATATHVCDTAAEVIIAWSICTGGEHIVLDRSASWVTPIDLPLKTFSDFVHIRTDGTLPVRGNRVDPTSSQLVTLSHTSINDIPLTFAQGQKKVRLSGIKFDTVTNGTEPGTFYLCTIPGGTQDALSDNPEDFILDHIAIAPASSKYIVHGLRLDGHLISVNDSSLGGIKTTGGQDCQAVWTLDGQGGHCFVNTFFEAASENYITGGAQNGIEGLVPQNFEFRRCYFSKDLDWVTYIDASNHTINEKNIFETKNSRRMYLEGCVMENHWDALRSQTFAIVNKSSVESSGDFNPWAISEDIRYENLLIRNIYGGFTAAVDVFTGAFQGRVPNSISFVNSAFVYVSHDFSYLGSTMTSRMFHLSKCQNLVFDHVFFLADLDNPMSVYVLTNNNYGFVMKDCIFPLVNTDDGLGIFGAGTSPGIVALNAGTGGSTYSTTLKDSDAVWSMKGNTIPKYAPFGNYPNSAPDTNNYPANYGAVGFEDFQTDGSGNYALDVGSTYKNSATDGTDPGPDWALLNERTATTESGTGHPTTQSGTPSTRHLMFLG